MMSQLFYIRKFCNVLYQIIFVRIHNETKYNNAILIKMKNTVAVNGVATKTDLIKKKKTKTEKTLMTMSVTADNEINSNKFKKKRNDR